MPKMAYANRHDLEPVPVVRQRGAGHSLVPSVHAREEEGEMYAKENRSDKQAP
jgi:hypothetical protein